MLSGKRTMLLTATLLMSETSGSPTLGVEIDAHGCNGPAGESWCEATKKCHRFGVDECPGGSTLIDIHQTISAMSETCQRCTSTAAGVLAQEKCIKHRTMQKCMTQKGTVQLCYWRGEDDGDLDGKFYGPGCDNYMPECEPCAYKPHDQYKFTMWGNCPTGFEHITTAEECVQAAISTGFKSEAFSTSDWRFRSESRPHSCLWKDQGKDKQWVDLMDRVVGSAEQPTCTSSKYAGCFCKRTKRSTKYEFTTTDCSPGYEHITKWVDENGVDDCHAAAVSTGKWKSELEGVVSKRGKNYRTCFFQLGSRESGGKTVSVLNERVVGSAEQPTCSSNEFAGCFCKRTPHPDDKIPNKQKCTRNLDKRSCSNTKGDDWSCEWKGYSWGEHCEAEEALTFIAHTFKAWIPIVIVLGVLALCLPVCILALCCGGATMCCIGATNAATSGPVGGDRV